jgi:excisionase family DNA binding protein
MSLRHASRRRLADRLPVQTHEPPFYLSRISAVQLTGLSERTIDYARARKEFPTVKYGRRVLIRREDLVAWLESRKVS